MQFDRFLTSLVPINIVIQNRLSNTQCKLEPVKDVESELQYCIPV